jgi:hypothetical protein
MFRVCWLLIESCVFRPNQTLTGCKGTGTLNFANGILNLQRSNVDGRYEITLHAYVFSDSEKDLIPKDDLIAGQRRFRNSWEAKVAAAIMN